MSGAPWEGVRHRTSTTAWNKMQFLDRSALLDPRCRIAAAALLVVAGWTWSLPVAATVPLQGVLLATQACPATISVHRSDAAGGIRLEPGRGYRVLGQNKAQATHYQVVVEGARPAERWIAVGCGTLTDDGTVGRDPDLGGHGAAAASRDQDRAADEIPAAGGEAQSAAAKRGTFVLALAWQPAFCEVNRRRPECQDQTPQRPDASRFSLHGLWPQPRDNAYCGVDARTRRLDQAGDWSDLPAPDLKPATRERLAGLMPGVRSGLDRHEWINHGTCYGTDAETYFAHALALLDQVNASPIRALFAGHRGRHLSSTQIRSAFDAAFGRGAGDRVRLVCAEGMIGELRLSLKGEIGQGSGIGSLMQAAAPLSTRCRGGRVDEAGLE
jgi:ribonuclease T2